MEAKESPEGRSMLTEMYSLRMDYAYCSFAERDTEAKKCPPDRDASIMLPRFFLSTRKKTPGRLGDAEQYSR